MEGSTTVTGNVNLQSLLLFNASTMTTATLEPGSYLKEVGYFDPPSSSTRSAPTQESKVAKVRRCKDQRACTLREIQTCKILQACPHPNVCGYRGVVVNNGMVTGLMFDRYDMNLREFLYSDFSDNMSISKCIQDIKSGIDHIHSLGLVHCDIKPDNIFVHLASARFVVGDFDSVHREGQRQTLKTGTEGWTPLDSDTKEIARREIDFYSLQMIQAWLEKKLSYGNDPQPSSDEELYWTTTILGEARGKFLREGNTQHAQNQTGEEESGVDEMDMSW